MKAIVIGATGLVGKEIVKQLLQLEVVTEVHLFGRRSVGIQSTRLKETLVNFDDLTSWRAQISGDVLFSALGTTMKAAGTKALQYRVDHDYQLDVAKAAAQNGVKTYVLISSVNANSKSAFFYLRMKGELEDQVKELPFQSISLLRPGPLKGFRENSRFGEVISTGVLSALPKFLIKDELIPVEGEKVAAAAIKAALANKRGSSVIGPAEILKN